MSFAKGDGRKRSRGAAKLRRAGRNKAGTKELLDNLSDGTPASPIGQIPEEAPGQPDQMIDVERSESSDSPARFVGGVNCDSSVLPKTEPDRSTFFDIVDVVSDAPLYLPGSDADSLEENADLIDPSKWFEQNDVEFLEERVEDEPVTLGDESSADQTCTSIPPLSVFDLTATMDAYSSAFATLNEKDNEVIESAAPQTTEGLRDERRRHPREDSSDLVWVEYFNSSMECIGKEAGRAENVGAGGMRISLKTAPFDIERVIVSYPYRGFESCSIVRSRYQDESGQQHLCVEFADREWKVNENGAVVDNSTYPGNPRKILLADDDAAFRKILGNILVKAGYEVVLAEDGQSAVDKAIKEKPDLVITDGLMPKLHGFQVCKAVKELNPQTGVIMLTAVYTTPNYLSEAKYKFGADDIITKPCQTADLLRKIEKYMPPVIPSNPRPEVNTDTLPASLASSAAR